LLVTRIDGADGFSQRIDNVENVVKLSNLRTIFGRRGQLGRTVRVESREPSSDSVVRAPFRLTERGEGIVDIGRADVGIGRRRERGSRVDQGRDARLNGRVGIERGKERGTRRRDVGRDKSRVRLWNVSGVLRFTAATHLGQRSERVTGVGNDIDPIGVAPCEGDLDEVHHRIAPPHTPASLPLTSLRIIEQTRPTWAETTAAATSAKAVVRIIVEIDECIICLLTRMNAIQASRLARRYNVKGLSGSKGA
jgi:hypothetical protein